MTFRQWGSNNPSWFCDRNMFQKKKHLPEVSQCHNWNLALSVSKYWRPPLKKKTSPVKCEGRSLKHTILHPTATSIRCCQAHGLLFLRFLCFLAKVERHLRMLDGYNRVVYCYHNPQVALLTCGLMDDHNYFYILYGWKWRMGMKWTGYMCIPEAWTFGSRNEHKYWPRVLWVQVIHHFHMF